MAGPANDTSQLSARDMRPPSKWVSPPMACSVMAGLAPNARAVSACPSSCSTIETKTMPAQTTANITPFAVLEDPIAPLNPKSTAMIQKLDMTRTGMPKSENEVATPRSAGRSGDDSAAGLAMGQTTSMTREGGLGDPRFRQHGLAV